VVFTSKAADGRQLYPSKIHSDFQNLSDNLKAQLLGKRVGDTITAEDGGAVTVLGIYQRPEYKAPFDDAKLDDDPSCGLPTIT
jgi:hypothetical protein